MKQMRIGVVSILLVLAFGVSVLGQYPGAVFEPDPAYIYYKFAFDPIQATVYIGDFADPYTAQDVDLSSLLVNGTVGPVSAEVIGSHPEFTGEVVKAIIPIAPFLEDYGAPLDTTNHSFEVIGAFETGDPFSKAGDVDLIGKSSASGGRHWIVPPDEILLHGDVDISGTIDVDDVVAVLSVMFGGGSVFGPLLIADCDCSHSVDIDDALYLVDYIFKAGPFPCHE